MYPQNCHDPAQASRACQVIFIRLASLAALMAGRWCGVLRVLAEPWMRRLPEFAYVTTAPVLGAPRNDGETVLFNTGGPRSRKRSEQIRSTIFDSDGGGSHPLGAHRVGRVWAIVTDRLPHRADRPRKSSLRNTAIRLLRELGFRDEEQAFAQLEGIPRESLHARTKPTGCASDAACGRQDPSAFLVNALVLGKCRNGLYDPKRPVIWTEKRLEQWLELHQIRSPFYR
jgi:hypothetical protein